jgi:hypothetical protein
MIDSSSTTHNFSSDRRNTMALSNSRSLVARLLILATFSFVVLSLSTPAPHAAQAPSNLWFVCSWSTTGPNGLTDYISDVIPPGPGSEPGTLVPAFRNYVAAKYGLTKPAISAGLIDCVYKTSEADAKTLVTRDANTPLSNGKPVLTGWKYGMQAPAGGGASLPATSPKPSNSAAPTPGTTGARSGAVGATAASASAAAAAAQQSAAEATVIVRLVDPVNSANAQAGKQYRAVVTEAVTAGRVTIPRDALAKLTLAPTAGGFTTQLVSLTIDGQATPVTSTSVTAESGIETATKKVGGFIKGLGSGATKAADALSATGARVALPPGTRLKFSTMIPPQAAGAAAPAPASAAAAAPSDAAAPPVRAGRATAAPAATSTSQATGGNRAAIAMCTYTHTDGKMYVSGIFDAGQFDADAWTFMNANWRPGEMPFQKYTHAIGNGGCTIYPSVARAQQVLDIWKQEQQKKGGTPYIVETGWAYTAADAAADAAPRTAPRRGGIGR